MGTGTPHCRSRVMQRLLSPSRTHALVICMVLELQPPPVCPALMYSSSRPLISGRFKNCVRPGYQCMSAATCSPAYTRAIVIRCSCHATATDTTTGHLRRPSQPLIR
jgi:hypothetical protein